MSEALRTERPRRRERAIRSTGLRQLPFARIRNPYRPVELMSADQIEAIHDASLRLLAEVGFEVLHEESRKILKAGGAMVDEATMRVRCDPAMIEAVIATAPASFTMHARDPQKSLLIGGDNLIFTAVGGPAFANDLDRGRRAGTYADMRDYIRLIHQLNVIHQEGGGPIEPTDLPSETRHLDFYELVLTLTDKSWQCWALGGYRVRDAIAMTAIASGIPESEIGSKIIAGTVINANSPMRLDIPMGEGLVELARNGQVTVATPFTLAGAMSPVTVVGALAQQNAEALFMVALTQLVRPGRPRSTAASPPTSTCAPERRPSARRNTPRPPWSAGSSPGATGFPIAPAMSIPPTASTCRRLTNPACRCGAASWAASTWWNMRRAGSKAG